MEFPDNINIYLDNLVGMRIFESSEVESLEEEAKTIYEELPKLYVNDISYCETSCLYSPLQRGGKVQITRGFFKVTSFGTSFLYACTRDDHKFVSKIFKKGLHVKHPEYGVGEITYSDNDKYLAIKFESGKDILVTDAKNANLEIIDHIE